MKEETDLKQVPITIETAHLFFNKRQMSFIVKLYKSVYKEGFLNGRKLVAILLFSISSFGQTSIVSAGNQVETIGEVFPIMQHVQKENLSLGVPRYEIPSAKPIVKKPSFWNKIIIFIKKLLR